MAGESIHAPPLIGDVGTLLDVLHMPTDCPTDTWLNASQTNGKTVWLADFHGDELETPG